MKAIFAALVLYPLISAADDAVGYISGVQLLNYCEPIGEAQGFCAGYVVSTLDTSRYFSSIVNLLPPMKGHAPVTNQVCPPDKVSIQQLELVVVKWLKENPAKLNYAASSLVLGALNEAFPCGK